MRDRSQGGVGRKQKKGLLLKAAGSEAAGGKLSF